MADKGKEIRVTRSFMPPFEEYTAMLKKLWESRWLTNMGDYHQELERQLKKYLNVDCLTLFANGHLALETIIQAMELTGEIITTPFTFVSTTHAITRNHLKPVFCDIRPDDFTLDHRLIEDLITPETSAILAVHVYGNPCHVKEIEEIGRRHGLKVIYDAAHAFGEELDGKSLAAFGDASMLSFHATKVFHTIEGGAVCYGNPALGYLLDGLKNFGIIDEETIELVGGNGKMNEFQAAMGLCNLNYIEQEIEKRRAVVLNYEQRLKGVEGIRLSPEVPGLKRNYAYFPVIFDGYRLSRDQVFDRLAKAGIHARKYFYPCINACGCYAKAYDPADTPVALAVSKQVLTLPVFAQLEQETVNEICDLILL